MTKYNNHRCEEDGYKFDSLAERARYRELKILQQAGEIYNLQVHPPYRLEVNGVLVCTYKADFEYRRSEDDIVTEDVKGHATREYKLKKRLMLACRGIEVQEVRV